MIENKIEYCKHVYESMNANPCPECGGDTHEIDWDLLKKQRKEHREKYGILHTVSVWWSI